MSSRDAFLIGDLVILLICVPMILQLVPPNSFYGFHTPRTMADPAIWYRANLFAGWALAIAAAVGAASLWLAPVEFAFGPYGVALFIGPLLIALVASFVALGRMR